MSEDAPAVAPPATAAAESANAVDLILAPAFALGQIYTSTAHALGLQLLAQQAAQQQAAIALNSTTLAVCANILSLDSAASAKQP